jgi:predicted KAP-like P-loop ATPase
MLIPDYETEVDFLNCEAISKTVVELLVQNRSRALTIGIHGDWGAGKSSILKMVQRDLADDKSVACLWFNGWAFQGFEDAKTVLIEATITELCQQRSIYGKVKEMGGRLLKRVEWLKLLKRGGGLVFNAVTGLPSPDQIGTVLEKINATIGGLKDLTPDQIKEHLTEASTFLKPAEAAEANVPEIIHHFRKEFADLLEEAKIDQLVVLIDDLDRCLPATAIATLEAIRLFLFVPKTAFVIGADEGMIEYAVRQHFPDLPLASGPVSYTRNYLEKLIQVPFRIPALGTQETRVYVMLLLLESLLGGEHAGFKKLLSGAKAALNRPWLGTGLAQADVRAADSARASELDAAFVLATRIGPILGEGTKGNPRQIKRFLNAMLVRRAIAKARGFDSEVDQSKLAKLMLAERFQEDFYNYLAGKAMSSEDGNVAELHAFEEEVKAEKGETETPKKKSGQQTPEASDDDGAKWLARDWLRRWLTIPPSLGETDLRPYIFVTRDKRALAGPASIGGIDGLVEKLTGSGLALRMIEPEVRALQAQDAEAAFKALSEQVLQATDLKSPPEGFDGLGILAKHHPRFQSQLIALVSALDVRSLGIWIVRGWNEILTDGAAMGQFQTVLNEWAAQDENATLKRAAVQATDAVRRRKG